MRRGRARRGRRRIATGVLIAAIVAGAACGATGSDAPAPEAPAIVEHPHGEDVARITLTERAAERLGIDTARVRSTGERTVVSSASVLVDPSGVFWVYTSPDPLVFVRHRIEIHHEEGGRAFLLDGPPPGTDVVTVGVAELYGAEFEIGH